MALDGVCMYRCRRADGEGEVVVGGLVWERVGKSAYLRSDEFPSAWIHPVGCQTGGCLGRLKITTLAGPQKKQSVSKQGTDSHDGNGRRNKDKERIRSALDGACPCSSRHGESTCTEYQVHTAVSLILGRALRLSRRV